MVYTFKKLTSPDVSQLRNLIALFAQVFQEKAYLSLPPQEEYLLNFLNDPKHLVLICQDETGKVVGGLVAYILPKFEQERSEVYVYDLAVETSHQRKGIATELFNHLKNIAQEIGAAVIFLQADEEDSGALEFYRSLGVKEEKTVNFDINLKS